MFCIFILFLDIYFYSCWYLVILWLKNLKPRGNRTHLRWYGLINFSLVFICILPESCWVLLQSPAMTMRENLCLANLSPEAMLENTLSCKYIAGGHCALAKRLLNQSSCRCSGYGFRFVKRRFKSTPINIIYREHWRVWLRYV